jgi:hypothetical protein
MIPNDVKFLAVLRIRDILVRIWICGSVPLATDPDSDPTPDSDLTPDLNPDSTPDLAPDPGVLASDFQDKKS